MAYAAATSLQQTTHLLLDSPRTSLTSSTQKILKSARWAAKTLLRTLRRYDKIKNSSQGVLAVDARIRDEARRLEDQIESYAAAQFLHQSQYSQSHGSSRFSLDLDHLRNHINCFVKTAKKMEAEYMEELHKKPSPHPNIEELAAAAAAVSSSTTGESADDMIVSIGSFLLLREGIVEQSHTVGQLNVWGITGMAGIGKTTLVKKLFTDSVVKETFECRAFVTLGQKNYDFKEILRAIVAQLNADSSGDEMIMGGDENIYQYFTRSLNGRKFLIVLDDLWSIDGNFERRLGGLLPTGNCYGAVLITSRNEISMMRNSKSFFFEESLLDEEESWELLQWKVFGEGGGYCPPQLVKAGKKIAQNCDGLPLLIVTVAKHLLTAPMNPEYWNEVAKMKNNSLFQDAINEIYELLLPSYHYLDQNLKACFLYMGVFPQDYVVRKYRIIHLLRAERFVYGFGSDIFGYLVPTNLVVVRQRRFGSWYDIKGCNLHVVYRHLSKREGENDKFISILDSYVADGSIEPCIKGKRLLAIYHNTLLAMKEVYNSVASLSTLRSLLCTGPYHQYQVPICFELRLLRVLDELSIRFYEFPVE